MRMRTRWIPVSLTVGLLAAATTGGAVLASGGGSDGNDRQDATGAHELETRVAEILGTDRQVTVDAFAQVDAEIEAEFVDESLRQAIADGSITEEQADAIRTQVQSGDYSGFDQLLVDFLLTVRDLDIPFDAAETNEAETAPDRDYANRIGAILNVDGQRVADAIDQAVKELFLVDHEPIERAPAGAVAG